MTLFPMTPADDWEQLRWVCVELDNGAAVHLCVRRTHRRTNTQVHEQQWNPEA